MLEPPVVVDPELFVLILVKRGEIVASLNIIRLLVVQDPFSMKFIILPLTLVCDSTVWVVQSAMPVHSVAVPVPRVLPSLIVVESAKPISSTIHFRALVRTLLELLFDNHLIPDCFLRILHILLFHPILFISSIIER